MKTTFEYVLTAEQLTKAMQFNSRHLIQNIPRRWLLRLVGLLTWIAISLNFFYAFSAQAHGQSYAPMISLTLMIVGTVCYLILQNQGLQQLYRSNNHLVGAPCQLSIEAAGVRHSSDNCQSFMPWSAFSRLEDIGDLLLLALDHLHYLAIPTTAFESPEEKQSFITYVREQIAAAPRGASVTLAEASAPVASAQSQAVADVVAGSNSAGLALGRNLINAVKLAFLRAVPDEQLPVSWWQVSVFALISLLPPLIGDVAQVGLNGQLSGQNLAEVLVHLPILLFAAVAAAYVIGQSERTLRLLQCFLMITVVVDIFLYLLDSISHMSSAPSWFRVLQLDGAAWPMLWLAGACATVAVQRISTSVPRGLFASALCAALVLVPLTAVDRDRSLWHSASSNDELAESSYSGRFGEDNLYNQLDILEREIAAVQPGRPGVVDLYFIGMAGYGGQNVFMKEVNAVSELFQQRFGAAGKTIRLINNRKDPGATPLASVTSLRAALKRVAAAMNKDEDMLFLFLTSHGSQDHRFSLDLWPIRFHDLDPPKLRALLDESGIKNRVVVVSACYSGGFVESLKSEDTLVITASAPDKNSFGCSNDADWTYFGKAYFDQALRQTFSFTDAFKIANSAIAAREAKEDFTPSDPRIALGAALKPKLLQLEKQLAAQR
jgi:hypothetical protein